MLSSLYFIGVLFCRLEAIWAICHVLCPMTSHISPYQLWHWYASVNIIQRVLRAEKLLHVPHSEDTTDNWKKGKRALFR